MNAGLLAAVPCLVTVASLAAQGLHVVPNSWASTEAPSMLATPGAGISERQQILIDASELSPLLGRRITGLVFRRDSGYGDALDPAQGTIVASLGVAATAPHSASPVWSANLPQRIECYRGPIVAPASPAIAAGGAGWTHPHAIDLQFSTPFAYSGGHLCIELEGTTNADVWWPIDAITDSAAGTVSAEGQACGPRSRQLGQTAFVAAADLVVGRTAICKLFSDLGTSTILIVGLGMLPSPFDLALIGSPGCWIYVEPIATVPSTVTTPILGTPFGAVTNVNLHIPAQSNLMGAPLALQWVEMTTNGVASSNALNCTIAATPPTLPMAVVWQRPNGNVIIDTTRAPVVGLRWE